MTVFTCFFLTSSAQQFCSRTMVFFDFGKSELRKDARQRLDSLMKAIGKGSYIVELSGHADSVNTEEFNMKLSEARNKAVEAYLKKKAKADMTIKIFSRGELRPYAPNDSEENMAKNRRVDVYLLAVEEGNKLVFRGNKNESLEMPADFSGPCSICEELKLQFLHNDHEARSANIPLKTTAGRELTTAGMALLSFECPEKSTACLPLILKMPYTTSARYDCISSMSLAKGGYWEHGKASVQFDRSANAIVAADACYNLGRWTGFNKPMADLCKHQVNFPDDLQILKTKVYTNDSVFFTEPSRMPLTLACGSSSMFSWASAGGSYYYYKDSWRSVLSKADNTGNCDTLFTYNLTKNSFKPIPVSDTTVYAKLKGFNTIKSIGYYVEELDLLLPLANVKKTTYSANYLNYDHIIKFEEDKPYRVKYSDVKTKYKKGKKKLKVTIKKSSLPAQEG